MSAKKFSKGSSVAAALVMTLDLMAAPAPATAQSALGEVDFTTTCSAAGQEAFNKGLTLLHHMMYIPAEAAFTGGTKADPECAMLNWGIAMSTFHPLWPGGPSEGEVERGNAAAERLRAGAGGSAVELALISSVLAYFNPDNGGYRPSIAAWAKAMEPVYETHSDNLDVAALYALGQLATSPRGEPTFARERAVGELLDGLHKTSPSHPGVIHYAIHAYDRPTLAERGLHYARIYADIAPEVPHALHMPAHIFVRMGLWEENNKWNARSAAAARSQPNNGVIAGHFSHAMDYQIYGHLQLGNFAKAEELLSDFLSVPNLQPNFGSAYALAASPVRVLLEQEKWAEAAAMSTSLHGAIAWEEFPQSMSMVWFGKGIGAARSGDLSQASAALAELATIHERLEDSKLGYWAALTEAQMLSIEAWREHAMGNSELAVQLQTRAADLEDKVGKSPVTPGHVLPARELLGDLLGELGDDTAAAQAYQQSLAHSKNRRRSMVNG